MPRAIAFMFAAFAASDARAEWYGPDYRPCAEKATVQIVACVNERAAHWDRDSTAPIDN